MIDLFLTICSIPLWLLSIYIAVCSIIGKVTIQINTTIKKAPIFGFFMSFILGGFAYILTIVANGH